MLIVVLSSPKLHRYRILNYLDLDRDCVPGLELINFVAGKLKIDLARLNFVT